MWLLQKSEMGVVTHDKLPIPCRLSGKNRLLASGFYGPVDFCNSHVSYVKKLF